MRNFWYKIVSFQNNIRIEFQQHKNNKWPITILSECPFPKKNFLNKNIIITGKAPGWMYVAIALVAVENNAGSISIEQPNLEQPIQIFPIENTDSKDHFFEFETFSDLGIVHFVPLREDKKWLPDIQSQIPSFFNSYKNLKHCCITGTGANWMYASFAVQALIAGIKKISCFIPREYNDKIIVLYNHKLSGDIETNKQLTNKLSINGNVIGVVGDPNSGKSVFSAALAAVAYDLKINSWTLDCDGASPTPKWFTAMLRKQKAEQAINIRKKQKVEWNHQLEKNIAKQIGNLKNSCQLTIADMPGGDHRDKNNIMRIPPGREVMMKAVDKFIILGRKNEKVAELWIKELKKHKLDDRIVAVINSHSPDAPPNCSISKGNDNIFHGEISGLDRKNEISLLITAFKDNISKLLKKYLL